MFSIYILFSIHRNLLGHFPIDLPWKTEQLTLIYERKQDMSKMYVYETFIWYIVERLIKIITKENGTIHLFDKPMN